MAILLDSVGGTTTSNSAVRWIHTPYGIRISEDPTHAFTTLRQHIDQVLSVDKSEGGQYATGDAEGVNKFEDTIYSTKVPSQGFSTTGGADLVNGKTTYMAPNYTDTRVGGNDAINPYWQFNRDDDITPPMFSIGGVDNNGRRGMGRVYAETYEANQSILWLQMGVPEFANLIDLFTNSGNADAAKAMNQGSLLSLGSKIITLVLKGAIWLITFPITAPLHLIRWIGSFSANEITKFYHFRPSMPMYYDMVNSMLAYLAVNIGIYPAYLMRRPNDMQRKYKDLAEEQKGQNALTKNETDDILRAAMDTENPEKLIEQSAIPDLLKSGPDIYKILNRRRLNFNDAVKEISARDLLMDTASKDTQKYNKVQVVRGDDGNVYKVKTSEGKDSPVSFFSYLKSSILGAFDFVGFKCEKGVNTTDSVTNSTASSPLFEQLNQISRDRLISLNQRSMLGRAIIRLGTGTSLDNIVKAELTKFGLETMSLVGLGDSGTIIANGNGFYDVPEMWSGSNFDRSISFNIQLRARYGDPVSIYQSIYIPLMMLLCAACPRAIGDNMYTSPFLVKAYCKGKFSLSCGMVTSINITRGKDSFGWSDDELPTAVDVQMTIKDLAPNMYLAMQDIGLFDTFTRNESIMDYLDTLSALGIYERMYTLPRALRKLTAACLVKKNTIFSKEWWAFNTAKTRAGLAFSAFTPWRPFLEKEDKDAIVQGQ